MINPPRFSSVKTIPRVLGISWILLGTLLAAVAVGIGIVERSALQAEVQNSLILKAGWIGAWADMAMALVFFILGSGLMRCQRWARRLAILACWFWIVGGFFVIATFLIFGGGFVFGAGGKIDIRFLSWLPHFSITLFSSLVLVLPSVVSLAYLQQPKTQRLFEDVDLEPNWTEQIPLETLGYGLFLGLLALGMFAAWYLTGTMFPFWGELQTGWAAAGLYVLFGLFWAGTAVGVCLHRRREWILSMFVGTALAVSVVRTLLVVEASDFFRAMGVSGLQFAFFNRIGISNTAGLAVVAMGAYVLFLGFWLWNEKSFRATGDFIKLQESGFVLDERFQVVLAVGLGVVVGACLYAYQTHREQNSAQALSRENAERPRREAEEITDSLRATTASLPDCPLVFPLLDASGRVTPVGSYISYWAMVRASDFSTGGLASSDAGSLYQVFHLFGNRLNLPRELQKQMSVRFGGKNFGAGTMTPAGTGYLLRFKFWGIRAPKEYTITLAKGSLQLAPGLMAVCLREWMGIQTAPGQMAELSKPIFADDPGFRQAAEWECILRDAPFLVVHWDKIIPGYPDNPYWAARLASIHLARGESEALDRLELLIRKNGPGTASMKAAYVRGLSAENRWSEALHISLQELQRDSKSAFWYRTALDALCALKYWDEAIRLVQTWSEKRPEQVEPILKMGEIYRDWGLEALPNGLASAGTGEGARLYRERLGRGWSNIQKAARLAPLDGRVWCALLDYGRYVEVEQKEARIYFEKASAILPEDATPYALYLQNLKPKGMGSGKTMMEFAQGLRDKFPELYCKAWQDSVLMQCWGAGSTEDETECYRRMGQTVRQSPLWPVVEASYREALRRNPVDFDAWDGYLYWSQVVGKGDAALAYAKNLSSMKPEWVALYPNVLLRSIEQEKKSKATDAEKDAVEKRPEIAQRKDQALELLTTLEPDNYYAWNLLAQQSAAQGRAMEAKRAFKTFGDHWNPAVWSKEECEKTRHAVESGVSNPQSQRTQRIDNDPF